MKDPLISVRLLFILGLSLIVLAEPFQGIGSQLPTLEDSPFNENKTMENIKRSLSLKYQALVKKVFNRDINAEESILENGALPDSIFDSATNSSRNLVQLNRSLSRKINPNPIEQSLPSIATDSGVERVELQLTNQKSDTYSPEKTGSESIKASSDRELKNGSVEANPKQSAQEKAATEINVKSSPYSLDKQPINLHFNNAEERQIKRQTAPGFFVIKRTSESPFFKKQNSLVLDSSLNKAGKQASDGINGAGANLSKQGNAQIIDPSIRSKSNQSSFRQTKFEKPANSKAQFYRMFHSIHEAANSPRKQTLNQAYNETDLESKKSNDLLTRSLTKSGNKNPLLPSLEEVPEKSRIVNGRKVGLLSRKDKKRYASNLRQILNEQESRRPVQLSHHFGQNKELRQNFQVKGVKETSNGQLHVQYQNFKQEVARQEQQLNLQYNRANDPKKNFRNVDSSLQKGFSQISKPIKTQRTTVYLLRNSGSLQPNSSQIDKSFNQEITQRRLNFDRLKNESEKLPMSSQAKLPFASSSIFSGPSSIRNNQQARISTFHSGKAGL